MGFIRTALLCILVVGIMPPTANGQNPSPWSIEFRAGMVWIGNAFRYVDTDEGTEKVHGSAVSPLKAAPGVGARYHISRNLVGVASLDALYQEYVELPAQAPNAGKVVPTDTHIGSDSPYPDEELQNVAGVFVLPLHIGLDFPLIRREAVTTGPGAGVTIVARIPILIEGESTSGIASYHWGAGRFLHPELNWSAVFHTFDHLDYGLRLRAMYPMANLWALENDVGWWDGLTIGLQAIVQLGLGSPESGSE